MDLKDFASEFLNKTIRNDIEYTGMADSTRPQTISFLDNPKFAKGINENININTVLVREKDQNILRGDIEAIVVENPKAALFSLHNAYREKYLDYGANKIAQSADIHPSAYIAPKGVIIGENVRIAPNVTILKGVEIGDNTTIGPNCVIGEEGFHVFEDLRGVKRIVVHDGKVVIGKNVDIQASSTVDKGFMGRNTVIGDECKLDNFVHIAHRAHIGNKTILAGGSDIAGSATIGENVWIGPKSIVSNRVVVGNNAHILIGSIVIHNVKEGAFVSGNFAIPHEKHLQADARAWLYNNLE